MMQSNASNCGTPPMSSRRNSSHKAAISLNNAAVSLLVRGCFSEALETLEDAIKVMDVATYQAAAATTTAAAETPNGNVAATAASASDSWRDEQVRLALVRSCKRSALCSTKGMTPSPPPTSPSTQGCTSPMAAAAGNPMVTTNTTPTLHAISSQCNPARIYEVLTSCADTASLHVAFPMTIDGVESNEDYDVCSSERVSFEIGVVLHNYGVAYDCVAAQLAASSQQSLETDAATQASIRNTRAMMQAKAFHMFQWSSALLAKVDLESHHIMPACLASQLLLLRTVLTHNLINDAILLNLDYEYHEYCQIMQSLLHLVEAQHLLLPINDHHIAAAA